MNRDTDFVAPFMLIVKTISVHVLDHSFNEHTIRYKIFCEISKSIALVGSHFYNLDKKTTTVNNQIEWRVSSQILNQKKTCFEIKRLYVQL